MTLRSSVSDNRVSDRSIQEEELHTLPRGLLSALADVGSASIRRPSSSMSSSRASSDESSRTIELALLGRLGDGGRLLSFLLALDRKKFKPMMDRLPLLSSDSVPTDDEADDWTLALDDLRLKKGMLELDFLVLSKLVRDRLTLKLPVSDLFSGRSSGPLLLVNGAR